MRILIIDDDKALCRSIQIQLEGENHSVDVAHNGADGLDRINAIKPDIVFLDLNLPDTTGLQILRTLDAGKCESVIIMITGVQDASATIEAIRSGAFDYIRKPFDLDALLLAIEKAGRLIERRGWTDYSPGDGLKSVPYILEQSNAPYDFLQKIPEGNGRPGRATLPWPQGPGDLR